MKQVAALFVRHDSIYKSMPGVDCYDIERDAYTWPGGCPVVAHPPCRLWGRLRRFSSAPPEEMELARWAVDMVRQWGGVLEHPAASRLWWDGKGMAFPDQGVPTVDDFGGFTLVVNQCWWGHKAQKRTWLYVCGCTAQDVPSMPLRFDEPTHVIASTKRELPEVPRREREATPADLATWLVGLARICSGGGPVT